MNNGDSPANPFNNIDRAMQTVDKQFQGLTKREAFAKDLPHIEVEFGNLGIMCEFIGVTNVPVGIDEILAVTFATEAKIRVMRADALLKELSK